MCLTSSFKLRPKISFSIHSRFNYFSHSMSVVWPRGYWVSCHSSITNPSNCAHQVRTFVAVNAYCPLIIGHKMLSPKLIISSSWNTWKSQLTQVATTQTEDVRWIEPDLSIDTTKQQTTIKINMRTKSWSNSEFLSRHTSRQIRSQQFIHLWTQCSK